MEEEKRQELKLLVDEINDLATKITGLQADHKALLLKLKDMYKGRAGMKIVK